MPGKYGLIGRPLSHSFSPGYFAQKFRDERSSDTYTAFPLDDISDLPALLAAQPGLTGLNVTIPYKETVLPFLDTVSADAAAIGAVNCIRISRRGNTPFLEGFNTDWSAFLETIPSRVLEQRPPALVLGTGGAAKAVTHALAGAGIPFDRVSRKSTGEAIAWKHLSPELLRTRLFVVNTTPLGMFPHTEGIPPLPYEAITAAHVLYDLVYNPALTRFLQEGRSRGASVINGYDMLCLQADKSLNIWREQ